MKRTIVLGQTGISIEGYQDQRDDGIVLDENQEAAINRIETATDRHWYLTGPPGAGKSRTIKKLAGENPLAMTIDMFLSHR
jgi:ABC-type molybdenum transport system ATPase subunit/photorepair protein PhrA